VDYVKQVFVGCQLGDTLRIIGKDTIYVPDLSQIYVLYQSQDGDELQAIEALYSLDATLYAEPNFIRQLDRTPIDTYWDFQWNLKDDSYNGIGCQFAWDATTGSPVIKLAILDSGVNYNHADLGGPGFPNLKVAGGWDYADNDNDPMDYCDQSGHLGHGSQCAGVAGALTNNSSFIAGIAGGWHQSGSDVGNKIYALKIFHNDCAWGGDPAAANAIVNAADPNVFGCQILSNSWSGPGYSETIRGAINFAYRTGASFVAAKGNEGTSDPRYPADYDNSWVTAVGAYGQNGNYCQIGNCGYASNYGGEIDIAAPGIDVPSTNRLAGIDPGFNGTSASCPHVAGSIGLIRSKMSGLRNEDTEWIIKFSAADNYSGGDNNVWTWNEHYGHGDLRISTAMARLGHPYVYTGYKMFAHTATGGFEAGHSGLTGYWFYGAPLHGHLYVYRYDVRVNVTYPELFDGLPFVWGVGFNTIGWSGSGANYQVGFCRVYPNSQTSTGCQLQTFVYDVYDELGRHIGWYPCHVNEVSLRYKVWGTPHIINPNGPTEPKVDAANAAFKFDFSSIYPNPFNANVKINFTLPDNQYATIDIFNLLGQKVATLFDESASKGSHSVIWNGKDNNKKDVPSGVYFCKLKGNGKLITQKITLLR
jgi:thermitase